MSIKRTFTLIEMLIVVVIIGILAAALIPRLQSVQARARDTKRKADLHQIGTALSIYKEDHGGFKEFENDGFNDWKRPVFGADHNTVCQGYYQRNGRGASNAIGIQAVGKYMTAIPDDPNLSTPWGYDGGDPDLCGYGLYILAKGPDITNNSTFYSVGFMIAAKTESDGASSNRVQNTYLINNPTNGLAITYDSNGSWVGDLAGGALAAYLAVTSSAPPLFSTPETYNTYMCNKVTFTGAGGDANLSGDCYVDKNADDLRYIYVQ